MRGLGLALFACVLGGCQAQEPVEAAPTVAENPRRSPAGLQLLPLTVTSGGREHRFTVEVARSAEEQSRGLMFRQQLGPAEGMLFPLEPPRVAGFWMRNTLIPLDMIFIRADGTIARIAANTVPGALDPVRSGEPVAAVLEIAGGRSAALGIAEGDVVNWTAGGL